MAPSYIVSLSQGWGQGYNNHNVVTTYRSSTLPEYFKHSSGRPFLVPPKPPPTNSISYIISLYRKCPLSLDMKTMHLYYTLSLKCCLKQSSVYCTVLTKSPWFPALVGSSPLNVHHNTSTFYLFTISILVSSFIYIV